MRIPMIGKFHRRKRIELVVQQLGWHEEGMRDCLAQLIELTEPDDDLHCECRRLLAALEG